MKLYFLVFVRRKEVEQETSERELTNFRITQTWSGFSGIILRIFCWQVAETE